MRTLLFVCVALVVGCKKKSEPAATTGSGSAGSGSDVGSGSAGSGSGSAAVAAPACNFAGNYRVRFHSNGADGWWLRFKVEGTPPKAMLVSAQEMLGFDKVGPIDVAADQATCTLTLTAKNEQVGDMKMTMKIDPATKLISGELTRTDKYSKGPSPVHGAIDYGEPLAAADACFAPAIWELVFDESSAKWKNEESDDKRSCKDPMVLPRHVRVEVLGPDVAADYVRVMGEGKNQEIDDTFGKEVVSRGGPCELNIEMQTEGTEFKGKLTFTADGKVTGTAESIKNETVEDGDEGEGTWWCVAKNVKISGTRIKQL